MDLNNFLDILRKTETTGQLINNVGNPDFSSVLDPEDESHLYMRAFKDKEDFKREFLFEPKGLEVPIKTAFIAYQFVDNASLTGAPVLVFYDENDIIFGWAYHKGFHRFDFVDRSCLGARPKTTKKY